MVPSLNKYVVLLIGLCYHSYAQTNYRSADGSTISISGTSTLHAWSMTAEDVKIQSRIGFGDSGELQSIDALNLSVKVESLKSGHSAMDRNAYSSLDAETHKSIVFSLTSANVSEKKIICKGNLTVAGVSQPIVIESSYQINETKIICKGNKDLKMSDFGIEPPSFMFGTVRTGDEINVNFSIQLQPTNK